MWMWVFIIILLAIIEISTVNLTTIWFVASALVSLILSFFIEDIFIQFLVFVLLGLILLLTTRKYLLKLLRVKDSKTNLDRVVGMNGIVTEDIDKLSPGEVKVDGKKWTAVADKSIAKGSTIEVLEITGVKLKVKEVN